jgi:hypothetical protein
MTSRICGGGEFLSILRREVQSVSQSLQGCRSWPDIAGFEMLKPTKADGRAVRERFLG